MMEKQPSQRKLKKGHVLQSVLKQIKDDTEKLWKSARSLTGVEDDEPSSPDADADAAAAANQEQEGHASVPPMVDIHTVTVVDTAASPQPH